MLRNQKSEDAVTLSLLGTPTQPLLSADALSSHTASVEHAAEEPQQHATNANKATVNVGSKSFFSNERTFMTWMNMAVMLSAISVTILALGASDATTELYGLLMLPVAVAFCLYALFMFMVRASAMRRRVVGAFEDRTGPVVLTLLLMGVIVADMIIAIIHIRSR